MYEYIRNQVVVKKFYPHWNEERVKVLAKEIDALDEIEAVHHLFRWTNDGIQVSTKTDDDLLRVDYAICVLEEAAGENSVLPDREQPNFASLTS